MNDRRPQPRSSRSATCASPSPSTRALVRAVDGAQLRRHARPGARHRRRERLRQERDHEGRSCSSSSRRAASRRARSCFRAATAGTRRRSSTRLAAAAGAAMRGDPRRRDRAHPAGADGRVQPGAHGRATRSSRRSCCTAQWRPDGPPLSRREARADHGRPVPRRRHLDAGAAHRRLFLAALGRPAPARDDRHGAVLQAAPADRRRADDRDRRHDPGAGAGPAARAAAQVPDRRSSSSPTTSA